jgi:hypothetical protein
MSTNPFVLDKSAYKRDLNILRYYMRDSATYLSIMTGRHYDECIEFIKKELRPGGKFEFKDPTIMYLERGANGDREEKTGKLSEYINSAIKDGDLIAPTLTTYLKPSVKESLLVPFIDSNVKARGIAKKAMFAAKQAGDKVLEAFKKGEQTNKKLNNNSISGAHVSASTPLYNKTAHSTLTSNCRSTSGYGNANNEKFLCGNRHYWSPDIVRNNIISIINNTDYEKLSNCITKYSLRHPTVDETIACIRYSTDLYWKGVANNESIALLVSKLTDIQRSAFVYTGDLYHLMKYNNSVVYEFIGKLSAKIIPENIDPSIMVNNVVIDNASDDIRNLASQICSVEMRGKSLKDIIGTTAYSIYAATVENIINTLDEYSDLIRALWVTPNIPASVAFFPDSIRRAAVTSDTDSTIFTVQDWVIWHCGKLAFDQRADAVAATVIFLASQTITHVLARMSANFGIEEKRLHQIAMKNEFKFPIFVPTSVAKHYFALISCQEGNVFKDYEKEIKGVHLKSSNAPKEIIKDAEKLMIALMNTVIEGKKISIREVLTHIANKERSIVESIRLGKHEYFRMGQIKTSDSYKEGEKASPYQQYLLWNKVFAPKYGDIQEPPYLTVKISTELNTPTNTKEWINSIQDKGIANRLEEWLDKSNRKTFGSTFMLPEQIISTNGIPEEILLAIDIRRIVLDCSRIYYIILETLGIFMLNNKSTRLCMDEY